MAAKTGDSVKIGPYDLVHNPDWPDPQEGDWLVTYSERTDQWGRAYRIDSVHKVRSEAHPRRFTLHCTVIGPEADAGIGPEEQVYPLVWYPRERKRPR